ncbi:MAG: PqqD family peptide modification chaperone [Pseudomonadota bacterium]
MAFEPTTRLVRASQIIATEVDGEIVLISIEDGKYFGLDAIGSEIWRRLEEPRSVEALTAELQDHFDGDPETIERETLDFLDKLSEQKLLAAAQD